MQNVEIAKYLGEIADMMELIGENFFHVRAYRNASRAVLDYPGNFSKLTLKQMEGVPDIGKSLSAKIDTLVKSGELTIHQELRKKVPPGLMDVMKLPALGPKRVKQLHEEIGVASLADLKNALESGAVRTIRGFGPKMEETIRAALERRPEIISKRWLYADAAIEVERLLKYLRPCPAVDRIEAAGSFRRKRDTVGDIDLLAISSDPAQVMRRLTEYPNVAQVVGSGDTKTTVMLNDGLQVDLRVLPEESYGAALIYFTGSKDHCVHVRRIAQRMELSLNEYGLLRGSDSIAGKTEEEVYRALGLEWIAPELREDRGEIKAAMDHHLPRLITREDLRGDLHSHSTYTDGRASIEEMARAAEAAGLEYFAVTDHSQRLAMVNGLTPERLREQWREIDAVQSRVKVKLLRGIEVDILEDGALDLPDEVLAELDWVVASVHSKLQQPHAEMTRRIVTAIRNPNVDAIGHPTGRLLIDKRAPSSFDFNEVTRAAASEGCALEINSQVNRLDLIDTNCIAAKNAGAKLVISSDSHSPKGFGLLQFGVNQARRGWIEADDVLNTRPLSELRQR
ncbi:MAG TPA: DNA polymerase/3'-5' exonuclease PolX [Candidatus Binataceae bacterium]|nr:DNA polymerase/3'-5' exonuclease PolX [Candidatus Binataceae bacterium]